MYNKLFSKIVDSSIWMTPEATRIVWVMMLAVMDQDGFVTLAGPLNVAHRARVSIEDAEKALAILEAPDPHSANPAHEGRRIERVPGGWIVLNAAAYREQVTAVAIREQTRERVRRFRDKKRGVTGSNGQVTLPGMEKPAVMEPVYFGESAKVADGAVEAVFGYWKNALSNESAKLTPKRKKVIADRLKEGYSHQDIVKAIDGCASSEFHQGKNDRGTKFTDIELICRSGEKVEAFMAMAAKPKTKSIAAQAMDQIRSKGLVLRGKK